MRKIRVNYQKAINKKYDQMKTITKKQKWK